MEKMLQGVKGVVVYIDDILVTGKMDEEHLRNLEQVLKRLLEHDLQLKKKCQLLQRLLGVPRGCRTATPARQGGGYH